MYMKIKCSIWNNEWWYNKEKVENRIPKTNEKLKKKTQSKVRNMWIGEFIERKVGFKVHRNTMRDILIERETTRNILGKIKLSYTVIQVELIYFSID